MYAGEGRTYRAEVTFGEMDWERSWLRGLVLSISACVWGVVEGARDLPSVGRGSFKNNGGLQRDREREPTMMAMKKEEELEEEIKERERKESKGKERGGGFSSLLYYSDSRSH